MPRSGPAEPSRLTPAALRDRARTVRRYSREMSDPDAAAQLRQLADELDAEADALEMPVKPDVADP